MTSSVKSPLLLQEDDESVPSSHRYQCQGFPETFVTLDKFFKDLCTNYGRSKEDMGKIVDIFIVCTRYGMILSPHTSCV